MADPARQLASLPLALLLLAPGQRIASANPAAEQLLGQSSRRLIDRPVSDVIRFEEPRLGERMTASDAQISARATPVMVTGQGLRRLDVTVAPLVDQPGWQVMTLHDAMSAEALRGDDNDDSVPRAPEILAHEIKNPLAGIKGAAQLLARKLSGSERALTGLIAEEVDRIASLIDQMQSLSSRTPPKLESCNLHEAIRRARAVIEAGGKAPPIAEEFDPSLPPVLANADALVQVLINLLSNAAEASAEVAAPRITVRTRFASGLQLHRTVAGQPVRLPIELRVSDNGPGVERTVRDHLFEPFVTTKKSGQGLGLALVRRMVRDMNGRITHDREEAAGLTHFRVHLAMADQATPRTGGAAS
ncbi:ATP-binding protein [Novosphingobium sp.]|uniref:two-component system sensor histidine kinase NtrB n=1 Tax=Novosphingobium sp. TaxID=1874826 RepID=UPI0022C259FF|nr:ATP-binding protein [Novosphingobium sp.]MCZ8017348.1 ATP-binding protein [Novosphingobium sp.]MCZ8034129.1 ATP-binding protein [Novosphingobium sp.]MCZ8051484.1 ATP-binding protein [Novosphingobium sp.]MCZ8059830.1 ATP-binding protein [Novosphingobium sp.]MCZ8231668.1 ATP-binding protein [Novosphingobium sp.]